MNTASNNSTPGMKGERSLWSSFARGVRDNLLAEFGVQAIRLGGFVLLARALDPSDFGLFRALLAVTAIWALASEAGIPDALIQREDLTERHESTAWWMSIGLALFSAFTLYACAPLVARLMQMPSLTWSLRLLSIPLFMEGTSAVANGLLRRRLEFGALAKADVFAEIGFLACAMALLEFGMPRWALPAALALRFTIHALAVWIAARYVPRSAPQLAAARDLGNFSMRVLGGRILATASANADYLMVGRLLGSQALGFYGMAWDLLRFIPDRLHKVAGRVALPAFCRIADRNEELAQAFRDFISYISRIVLPIVVCAAVAAPEIIGGIYGQKWVGAAMPLRLLSIGLALGGLRFPIGAIFYAKNHPEFDIYLHSMRLALIVTTISLVAGAGLYGVSAGMSAVETVVSFGGFWLACAPIGLGLLSLAAACMPGLNVALWCGLATAIGRAIAMAAGISGAAALPVIVVPPALVFCWLQLGTARQLATMAFRPKSIDLTANVAGGQA